MKVNFYLLLFLSLVTSLVSASEPVSTGFFNNTAVTGHDVTAYHTLSLGDKAVKGDKIYSLEWKGAKWYFVSEAEKKKFESSPEKYAPAYNGHCANALSLGEGLIKTSGEHWAVFDGQLYLFYAARGAKRWLTGDYKAYKQVSDKAWKEILQERSQ